MIVIEQFIFGSIARSSGYSILGRSAGITPSQERWLTATCEQYDQQQYAVMPVDYSLCWYRQEQMAVLLEIFGGWRDRVGRASRVMRACLFTPQAIAALDHYPWLIQPQLPPLRRVLQTREPLPLDLPTLEICPDDLVTYWQRETHYIFGCLARWSPSQQRLFRLLLSQRPSVPLPCEQDQSNLLRVLAYVLGPQERRTWECESFSLNEQPPRGICFRYKEYCQEPDPLQDLPVPSLQDLIDPAARNLTSSATQLWLVLRGLHARYHYPVLLSWQRKRSAHNLLLLILAIWITGISSIAWGAAIASPLIRWGLGSLLLLLLTLSWLGLGRKLR